MGILDRILGRTSKEEEATQNLSFVECVDILQSWKTRSSIDTDLLTLPDKRLDAAKNSLVACPYCNHKMSFRQALVGGGVTTKVRCPACRTEPVVHHEY